MGDFKIHDNKEAVKKISVDFTLCFLFEQPCSFHRSGRKGCVGG